MMERRRTRHHKKIEVPDPASYDEEVLAEQVRQLFAIAPLGLLATIINSILVFVIMKDVTSTDLLVLWQAAIVAVTALRTWYVVAFHRRDGSEGGALWQRRFVATALLVGLVWGSIGLIPFTFSLAHQVFLAFVLGGMAAGASSTFSKIRYGFAAYAIPAIAPLAVHFLLIGDNFHYAMAAMSVLYLVLLGYLAKHNYLVYRDSILLRFENRDMLETLRGANQDMEALNSQLREEIAAKLEAEAELKAHRNELARTVEERTADLRRANEQLKEEIQERSVAEDALRESRERLVLAQRAGRVGVFDWDMNTGQVVVTAELEELYGLSPGEFRNDYRAWMHRVYPPDLKEVEEKLRRWIGERARHVETEYRLMGGDGTHRWMAATAQILYDAGGKPLRMIGTNVDITEMKEVQETLIVARDAAEGGSRAKSQFLANMSHEMRTPLAGVLGMIKLVLDTETGKEERELLGMAARSAQSLLRLIEDVLDFSRLEAGVMRFEEKPFDIAQVVASALEVVSLSAREKGVALSWSMEGNVPQQITGDAGRVRQVLVNLLGNAVKFTEQGMIEVAVALLLAGADGAGERILFSVTDTGVGVPPEQLEMIFENFTQVDSSLTKRYGGTGLGLALSRQIVQKMGGHIWVESSAGVGSTFFFTIPAHPSEDPA